MNDTNERSGAARGSHVELYRAVLALLDGVNDRYAKNPREWTCPHMQALDDMTQSEPQPTLTDAERHFLERCADASGSAGEAARSMLRRLT
jgi:hypothetical protein